MAHIAEENICLDTDVESGQAAEIKSTTEYVRIVEM
jgi:hypothetical protein